MVTERNKLPKNIYTRHIFYTLTWFVTVSCDISICWIQNTFLSQKRKKIYIVYTFIIILREHYIFIRHWIRVVPAQHLWAFDVGNLLFLFLLALWCNVSNVISRESISRRLALIRKQILKSGTGLRFVSNFFSPFLMELKSGLVVGFEI